MLYLSKISSRNLSGKICLLRVDLNVEDGRNLIFAFRVECLLPTLKFLRSRRCTVVIISHRGRPSPLKQTVLSSRFSISKKEKKFSLRPFSKVFSRLLKTSVQFENSFNFPKISERMRHAKPGSVFLLENIRFLKGEEEDGGALAKKLSQLADFYVNDAFASSHRKSASLCAITGFLPSYAGLLLEKELRILSGLTKSVKKPLTLIIGGAKISDKLGVLRRFISKADAVLLGGGAANTAFYTRNIPVGNSLADKNLDIKNQKYLFSEKIILPVDVNIKNRQILDIGEKTVKKYSDIIRKSGTIIWSGPMGLYEKKEFGKGTVGIWRAVLANKKARIIVGGGETVASFQKFKIQNSKSKISRNTFISTGGGAMLAYLAGKELPAISCLNRSIHQRKNRKSHFTF